MGLEKTDDSRQPFVAHVLKVTEDTSLEEDLGVTNLVLVRVNLDGSKNLLSGNLCVDESIANGVWSQNRVSII